MTIDELIEAYVRAFEDLMKAEDNLEKAFEEAKEVLPERVAYRKAEVALSKAVKDSEEGKQ